MTIDAHQHFWRFDPVRDAWITDQMAVLRQDFLPGDLAPLLAQNQLDGCVAVQADQSETETLFLLDLSRQNPFIKGVVGWVDLCAADLPKRLEAWSGEQKLKGFRHILQAHEPAFMLQPAFQQGLRTLDAYGYTYDILVFPRHLSAVQKLLKTNENQPFVLDHLAKPYIKRGLIRQWEKDLRRIARHEQVYCKISGLVTEADHQNWRNMDIQPYLEVALEAFSASRLMYGSDWPVCLLAADYATQKQVFDQFLLQLSATEQEKIMGLNAVQFYKINQA